MKKIALYRVTRHGQHVSPVMGEQETEAKLAELQKDEDRLVELGWLTAPAAMVIETIRSAT